MTSTAHDDQYTTAPEPLRQPYDTVAILKRNVADLEVALRKQTERAESYAETLRSIASYVGAGGYNADTVDAGVFEEKIRWGIGEVMKRMEKVEAELAKLREHEAKQKPVAMVDAGDDGYFAEILTDRSVSVGDMLYAFPPLNIDPELWKSSFDQWWDAHGQYLRAGGGQYEKTFGYHAWEAAAALYAFPVPAPAVPTDEQIHTAYRNALGQSIRERDMPEIRKFAHALLQSAEVTDNAAADRLLESGE